MSLFSGGQAARWAFGYVQVRQDQYQGMSPPASGSTLRVVAPRGTSIDRELRAHFASGLVVPR